jgi:flagellar basal-body rod modification protein FlgD
VSVKNASGAVIDTMNLGAETGGTHSFNWKSADPTLTGVTFSVTALSGAASVSTSALSSDMVNAVSTDSAGQLTVDTQNHGTLSYSAVAAVS